MNNYPDLQITITNCDSEPIHLIGNIQGHAGLIIAHPGTLCIEQASEGVETFLNGSNLTGKLISDFLQLPDDLLSYTQDCKHISVEPDFCWFLYYANEKIYIEFERQVGAESFDTNSFYRDLSHNLNKKQSIEQAGEVVCNMIRNLLSYDRVMLYRFDEDWHGEVIAEALQVGAESYANHHFPASDIPKQARAMMCRKKVRQIADVDKKPLGIHPYLNPRSGKPSDMELSEIRQPSDVHLQFLRNMKVQASLSISILVKGELWGLIACQHESALFIEHARRQACEAAGDLLGLFISAWKEDLNEEQFRLSEEHAAKVIRQIEERGSIVSGLKESLPALSGICSTSGFTVLLGQECFSYGNIPAEASIRQLQKLIDSKQGIQIEHTRNICRYASGKWNESATAAGFLAFDNSSGDHIEFFIWFKPEIQKERTWAGNPDKQQTSAPGLEGLHPRTSFEQWTELIKDHSEPWSRTEIASAKSFRREYLRVRNNLQRDKLEESLFKLERAKTDLESSNEKLNRVNNDLEKFAYTVSHDLRSPLNNISRLNYFLQTDFGNKVGEEGGKYFDMINDQIKKMNAFIDDILASSRSGKVLNEPVNPAEQILTVIKSLPNSKGVQISVQELPATIKYSGRHLRQIIQNLVGNAIKYHDKKNGKIEIGVNNLGKFWEFFVTDNGPGIPEESLPYIFDHFHTAHGTERKDSTGVGLAIVKETAEKHQGSVRVESTTGKGSTFYFTVPK